MISQAFIDQKYPVNKVLSFCEVAKSSYYFKPKPAHLKAKNGIAKSTFTLKKDGTKVDNIEVVEDIKKLLSEEFVDYGYIKTTYYLQDELSYLINHKKVYRLMKEYSLLNPPQKGNMSRKEWVKNLVPQPTVAFAYWEFDIKFIYIHHLGRYAPLLSVIDVYSRYLVGWILQMSIKKEDVKAFFDAILSDYHLPEKITVRCDNGSQFESNLMREYFETKGILQEFTKPATPQQNAHIESYHSILERAICRRIELKDEAETQKLFERWEQFYNQKRIHSGIAYKSPEKYLKEKNIEIPKKKVLLKLEKISNFDKQNETEKGTAGEQPKEG